LTENTKARAEIQQITDVICKTVPVERIYLFGSYAYGTPHKDSDYDFFVVLPDDSVRPLDVTRKIHKAVGRMPSIFSIDVLAESRSRFDELKKHNTLERKIEREGVKVYERA
jgi:predicted nucleotidyltransferase